MSDTELLRIYMLGFDYELSYPKNSPPHEFNDILKQRAYDIGRSDAIVGDDVSSNDNQTDEEILENIKNIPN